MKEVKVTNCRNCPFCNYDIEGGYDQCNLDTSLEASIYDQMPEFEPHTNCPLRKESVIIKL